METVEATSEEVATFERRMKALMVEALVALKDKGKGESKDGKDESKDGMNTVPPNRHRGCERCNGPTRGWNAHCNKKRRTYNVI